MSPRVPWWGSSAASAPSSPPLARALRRGALRRVAPGSPAPPVRVVVVAGLAGLRGERASRISGPVGVEWVRATLSDAPRRHALWSPWEGERSGTARLPFGRPHPGRPHLPVGVCGPVVSLRRVGLPSRGPRPGRCSCRVVVAAWGPFGTLVVGVVLPAAFGGAVRRGRGRGRVGAVLGQVERPWCCGAGDPGGLRGSDPRPPRRWCASQGCRRRRRPRRRRRGSLGRFRRSPRRRRPRRRRPGRRHPRPRCPLRHLLGRGRVVVVVVVVRCRRSALAVGGVRLSRRLLRCRVVGGLRSAVACLWWWRLVRLPLSRRRRAPRLPPPRPTSVACPNPEASGGRRSVGSEDRSGLAAEGWLPFGGRPPLCSVGPLSAAPCATLPPQDPGGVGNCG